MTLLGEKQVCSVEEAGRVLGIGGSAAYEAVRRGEIPAIRLGRRIVVPRAALERMLGGAGLIKDRDRDGA
jgi:excisionase family DNA binding protein